jgi:predicted metal-dependent TIM-barrel fold hydrolase
MYEQYSRQNLWLNSACDWGRSDPLSIPKTVLEMRRRGHRESAIEGLVYGNPVRFLSQNPRFQLRLE